MNIPTLEIAKQLIKKIEDSYSNSIVQYNPDERHYSGMLMIDISLEHFKSVVSLVELNLPGSAFALLRVQYESFIYSVWILNCATSAQLKQFKKNRLKKTMAGLITQIEDDNKDIAGMLSSGHHKAWRILNSYTHSGMLQLSRRINAKNEVGPNYSAAEIAESLEFSMRTAKLTAYQHALLVGDSSKIMWIENLIKEG
ncbi:DUF6988 family protein [Undibacterium sp. TC9W]|uniref:DUF6988 family protein n=1 Tax=Undibacterium sp. TC9W TaxID=3413053 RepID=UPI003BF0EDE1